MASRARLQLVVTLAAVLGFGVWVVAWAQSTPSGTTGRSAFAALKRLEGEWQGKALGPDKPAVTLRYRVAENGSTLIETFAPGTNLEMMTVYHLDGDTLVLTHYCAAGNQPRMKMNLAKSQTAAKSLAKSATGETGATAIAFDFADATNLKRDTDTYMRSGTLYLVNSNRIETEWTTYRRGKLLDTQRVVFTRVK